MYFFVFARCGALWLYSAQSYNLEFNLYAIDTDTYSVYTIGQVKDADGDLFSVIGMHYDAETGLFYAIANNRVTNLSKRGGILAINATTAQVVWSNNCTTAPHSRFAGMAFEPTRNLYVFAAAFSGSTPGLFYLTQEDMRAGNCGAMQVRVSEAPRIYPGGALYIPSYDALYYCQTMDYIGAYTYFVDMSYPVGDQIRLVKQNPEGVSRNWWFDQEFTGDYYYQSNGTVWAMGAEYGPGMSFLFQMSLPSRTEFVAGVNINGTGITAILPRALRALSDGPEISAASATRWRTGFQGSIVIVTPDNYFFELNIDTPSIRNVTRFSEHVVALESFGSWDQIVAVVNGSSGPSLAHVNITTGELTTISALPYLFTSLTLGADGKMLAMANLQNPTVYLAEIAFNGTITGLGFFDCFSCEKAWSDGTKVLFTLSGSWGTAARNGSDLSQPLGRSPSYGSICVDANDYGILIDCKRPFQSIRGDGYADLAFHAPSQGLLWAGTANSAITNFFRVNESNDRSYPIVDVHVYTADMGFFQYDAAWCSNRGAWNGFKCVCNNVYTVGNRCETLLPIPPAAPPADPPFSPPLYPPVTTPTATPSAAPIDTSPESVLPSPLSSPASASTPSTTGPAEAPKAPLTVAAASYKYFGSILSYLFVLLIIFM